jgi:Glu-tRNA(Gln) amidotransferase subunit E-like FAD-binding protein
LLFVKAVTAAGFTSQDLRKLWPHASKLGQSDDAAVSSYKAAKRRKVVAREESALLESEEQRVQDAAAAEAAAAAAAAAEQKQKQGRGRTTGHFQGRQPHRGRFGSR